MSKAKNYADKLQGISDIIVECVLEDDLDKAGFFLEDLKEYVYKLDELIIKSV